MLTHLENCPTRRNGAAYDCMHTVGIRAPSSDKLSIGNKSHNGFCVVCKIAGMASSITFLPIEISRSFHFTDNRSSATDPRTFV